MKKNELFDDVPEPGIKFDMIAAVGQVVET
jgi:hypothetical protein